MLTLNIIEPTLYDQTGHSFSYVQSLIKANSDMRLRVWIDRRGKDLLNGLACTTRAFFIRPLRQGQKIFLYRKLLSQSGAIFIGTSELWDLRVLAFLSDKIRVKATVFLHFHQFRKTPKKLAILRKLSNKIFNFHILAPTEKLLEVFKQHGFINYAVMPCPTYLPNIKSDQAPAHFKKILYAGAARKDKGFPRVVQLLQHMRARHNNIVFEIQISPPSSQRYDNATQIALSQLQALPATNLILHRETLTQSSYLRLFKNSLCLLLYDHKEYQDKFSGIALDAFYAGCPIITAKNTWMGDVAERFHAGIALAHYDISAIQQAIDKIVSNYATYHNNAKHAAQQLAAVHDPKNTLAYVQAAMMRNFTTESTIKSPMFDVA